MFQLYLIHYVVVISLEYNKTTIINVLNIIFLNCFLKKINFLTNKYYLVIIIMLQHFMMYWPCVVITFVYLKRT